jgi:hypothetical protein
MAFAKALGHSASDDFADAGLPIGESTDRRPVQLIATVREQGEKAVWQKTCDRQRRAELLGGGESEPDVLQAKAPRSPSVRTSRRRSARRKFCRPGLRTG